jgi:LCP family protein required for cell wall assembly
MLILAVVLFLAAGAFLGHLMGRGPAPILGLLGSSRVNILVLGVDERPDDVGRSDTLFVVTVNPKTQDMAIISVPRDTRIKIPGYGEDKINHAYAFGKYKLSQRAVEDLLGITINYYVTVDFNGFKRIIDALGGITIDVEKRMYYVDSWDGFTIDLQPGVQKLDGANAIAYVRYRDEEGDIGRIERQQKFMGAVVQQVTQLSTVGRLPTLIRELSGAVNTNMSTGDMINYGKIFNNARKQGLKGYMVPGTPAEIAGISYWLPDVVGTRKMMAEIMGTKVDERAAKVLAMEYEQSTPKETIIKTDDKTQAGAAKDKNSQTAKTGAAKQDTKPVNALPAKLRAEVINSSGNDDAGAKVVSELRKQGFEVVSVTKSGSEAKMTTVVEHTGSDAVLKKVNSLPFDYNLSIVKDSAGRAEITVIIGKNYK